MIQIKNAAELQKMRKACAISAAALKAGGEAIEPGITTAEIDKIIYDFIVRHGARPNFLHLYGFRIIHGIPNKQQQIRPATSSRSTPAARSTASTAIMPAPMRAARSTSRHSGCWMLPKKACIAALRWRAAAIG